MRDGMYGSRDVANEKSTSAKLTHAATAGMFETASIAAFEPVSCWHTAEKSQTNNEIAEGNEDERTETPTAMSRSF
jgi:hypothetical protein